MAIARGRAALGVCLVLLWQLGTGAGPSQAAVAPSTDPGLCLALAACWVGIKHERAFALWVVSLLSAMLLQGVPPLWNFLLGWPAWQVARNKRASFSAVVLALVCMGLSRCGGKLFAMGLAPQLFPLTLAAESLPGALLSEALSTAFLLTLFTGLLASPERP